MKFTFYKYQGTGNDFILIDDRENRFNGTAEQIERLCHRRFGIGADGLILLRSRPGYDFEMVYYNSDGRTSTMCGNGGRCIVAFAAYLRIIRGRTTFLAADGPHFAEIRYSNVHLQMKDVPEVQQAGDDLIINTGSPHYIIFTEDVDKVDIAPEAHNIRYNETYRQDGINVNFVQIVNKDKIRVRTYERGVEDETYSCGTGVVAAAIAAYVKLGLYNSHRFTDVYTKGGNLEVSFDITDGLFHNVFLIGPAEQVFKGELEI